MQLSDIMTPAPITVSPAESVAQAARTLTHYNIGALPVCRSDGTLQGLVTDRDLVIRCIAAGRDPEKTAVREVMTSKVIYAEPSMDTAVAAHLMGSRQIRRLPVVEQGRLCGMVSLGDLAKNEETVLDAGDALGDISGNVTGGTSW